MHKFSQTKVLHYSLDQIYDLVLDVDKYHEFLPWCGASRIVENHEGFFLADLVIQFKVFAEKYRSKVFFHNNSDGYASIEVEMIEGPFKYLTNFWRLKAVGDYVEIEIMVDFAFKSKILDIAVGNIFEKASKKMIEAFELRAAQLYGQSKA